MADMLIRKVPEELRHEFRVLCVERHTSMQQELIKFIRKEVEKAKRKR